MATALNATLLSPILDIVHRAGDADLRERALDAASRFPLDAEGWRAVAEAARVLVDREEPGSALRRAALRLAVRIPLRSVREHLRKIVAVGTDPDAGVVADALAAAGDPTQVVQVLKRIRAGKWEALEWLAAMPVERAGIAPADVPEPPDEDGADARLWRALVLARLGEFAALDAFVLGAEEPPPMFWGNPWSPYDRIARVRPLPLPMREHLLALDKRLAEESDGVFRGHPIVNAATGLRDAEGQAVSLEAPPRPDENATQRRARGPASTLSVYLQSMCLPSRVFLSSGRLTPSRLEVLRHLPQARAARIALNAVREANRRAAMLPEGTPAEATLGNTVVQLVGHLLAGEDWLVARMVDLHLAAERPALDDGQMAWVLSRAEPARVISELEGDLAPDQLKDRRLRVLGLVLEVADNYAGRAASPGRGAGPEGEAPTGAGELIDDVHEMAVTRGNAGAEPPPVPPRAEPPPAPPRAEPPEAEERLVHAQIRHEGRRRNSFVAGALNVVRCWIGLPEPERGATSDRAIPRIDLPPEGLELEAQLVYGDQVDTKTLVLPADRTARTIDCDLRINVPADEEDIAVDIAFRYRGRVFEAVQLRADVLPAGVPDEPARAPRVRVQVGRREVLELQDRKEFQATALWGGCGAPRGAASSSVRFFGGQGAGSFRLNDAQAAISWLNRQLFVAEQTLVYQRDARGATGEPELNAEHPEVLDFLRALARHGAGIFNQLLEQGFRDPGERIQIVNCAPDEYVPLEFAYDRGYPSDTATLCPAGVEALAATPDVAHCPACGPGPRSAAERDRVDTICPLGFWSLRKILERFDVDQESGAVYAEAPRRHRRALRPLSDIVFGASHNVSEADRSATWATLRASFAQPALAEDWDAWKGAVKSAPPLLLALPHHGVEAMLDYLEIGDSKQSGENCRLSRGQLSELYVNPGPVEPGPIVLLLGCRTADRVESGYANLARRFQRLHSSIVLGTLAQILGRHAAPVASELVSQLVAVTDPDADFGTILRRVRRRMLGKGYLMALCLVALGDAEWRLTPRA